LAIFRPLARLATWRQRAHVWCMSKRATKRPQSFTRPTHWTNDPVPLPQKGKDEEELSPTRYGDWEKNGIAIDF